MTKEKKRGTLWLGKETAWVEFPEEFSKIFSILPEPSEKPSVWTSQWNGHYKISRKMMNEIGIKEWIWNIYIGPIGWGGYEYWHEYAATDIPNVFVHSFSWTGEAWGGSRLLLSVNIEEKEFSSLGNIPKEVYREKFQEILEAIASGKPRNILLEEKRYKNWSWTETVPSEILDRIFQEIPKWSPESKALPNKTTLDEKVYEQFVHKIRTQVHSLTPIIEEEQVKAKQGGIYEWLYGKTKFSDVYYHIVNWEHKFEKETTLIVRWEFLTVNIPEKQFQILK